MGRRLPLLLPRSFKRSSTTSSRCTRTYPAWLCMSSGRMSVRWVACLAIMMSMLPAIARGQAPGTVVGVAPWSISPEYRAVQARALTMQRRLLLAMADSMPESLYRDKATPVQRDFAQQIRHAAGEAHRIAALTMGVTGGAELPDTASALARRAPASGATSMQPTITWTNG